MSLNLHDGWSSGYHKGVMDGTLGSFDEESVQYIAAVRQNFHNESYEYYFPQPFFAPDDEEFIFNDGYVQGILDSSEDETIENIASVYEDMAAEVFHFWAELNNMDYYDERSMSFEMLTFVDVQTRRICNCQWSEL